MTWSPSLQSAARDLQNRVADIAPDAFADAVDAEARRRLIQFADGVIAYRDMEREPRPAEPACVWRQGSTRLLDYGTIDGADKNGEPVLFVPSLINRSYILDLSHKRSLLRDLAGRGFRPLLVDWGDPGADELTYGLNDYITGPLDAALSAAHELTGRKVAVAGYCMGLSISFSSRTIQCMLLISRPMPSLVIGESKSISTKWACMPKT